MNFANHIAFGLCTTNIGLAMSNATATNDTTSVTLCIISSLIPDIDQPQSLIGRITSPLSQFIYSNYGHRTLTHSLLFLLITTVPAFVLEFFLLSSTRYSLIFTIAISSHILLDMFTTEGVEFLFPFSKTQYVVFTDPRYSITSGNKKHQLIVLSSIVIFTFEVITLQNLNRSETTELIEATLSPIELKNLNLKDLTTHIYQNSNGNPKRINEFIKRIRNEKNIHPASLNEVIHDRGKAKKSIGWFFLLILVFLLPLRYI